MAKRFFENIFPSYTPRELNTSPQYWRTRLFDMVDYIKKNAALSNDNDLYTGSTGIAFMFFCLAESDGYRNDAKKFLNYAIECLSLKPAILFSSSSACQFICGDAGINAVSAVIYHRVGNEILANKHLESFKKGAITCQPIDFFKPGGDELFVGRAGYLCGILWLEKILGKEILPDTDIIQLCSTIVESGRKYSRRTKSIFPLMYSYYKTEYLGAAHGLSTILQTLISFPQFIETNQSAKQDIKKSIDLLVSLQTDSGNFPCAMDELGSLKRPESDELVHWCHGSPGVVYLLAKAYLLFKEPSYLESCLKCGDLVWNKGLLKKGPGLCHGVAGNGYVFLLLYRLTGDTKHLYRAVMFGEFLFTDEFMKKSKTPDNMFSLFEGLAGTVCYLIDLTQPQKACFPFLDIF
ncbi:lanC-like protein 3 homolog [Daktulosphaira vitifoliae]|uniref:lanC-like protein 3 homolog n=1 Tax=Daktulosphaira vitifoliae TaxID=58002 RepID=UPI0021AA7D9E|nr:lanC-like protein 3 homolog [Daktulosphaira vitifoliae]XP_050543975.1 lanC-like protein 3 homolog [Daktulosphaira vitifoliae]